MAWDRKPYEQYKEEVLAALEHNRNYRIHDVLGLPASYLDPEVFPPDAAFLDDAPFARCLWKIPTISAVIPSWPANRPLQEPMR